MTLSQPTRVANLVYECVFLPIKEKQIIFVWVVYFTFINEHCR